MVSTCYLISKSSSRFANPFGIVPSVSMTIVITVTFIFHVFFCSLGDLDIHISFNVLSILIFGQPGRQSPL